MNQQEYNSTGRGPSQEDKILSFLQSRIGEEVSMPQLWAISGSMAVATRVSMLRKRGVNIANRTERANDGTIHSFYTLLAP